MLRARCDACERHSKRRLVALHRSHHPTPARSFRPHLSTPVQRKSQAKKAARLQREDKDRRRKAERERKAAALERKVRKSDGADEDAEDDTMAAVTFGRPAAVEETAAAATDDGDVFDDSDDELYAASRLLARKSAAKVSLAGPLVALHALRPGGWPLAAQRRTLPKCDASLGPHRLSPCPPDVSPRPAALSWNRSNARECDSLMRGWGRTCCLSRESVGCRCCSYCFWGRVAPQRLTPWPLSCVRRAGMGWAGQTRTQRAALIHRARPECLRHSSRLRLTQTRIAAHELARQPDAAPHHNGLSLERAPAKMQEAPHCSSCSSAPPRSSRHNLYS